MIYRSYTPSPPLAVLVERFWMCSDKPLHSRERILPSGTIELVINLREDEIRIYDHLRPDRCHRFSGAIVSGPYSRCFVIDPVQHASIIGVHFKPGGAFPFFGLPVDELADTHLDLETLWGRTAADLRERLCAASYTHQFSLLEDTLIKAMSRLPVRHRAVSKAIEIFDQTGGGARIRDVARTIGLSQRRFIQVFAAEVGLTPKLYSRVRRFQRAIELVQNVETPVVWAQIAIECGYFDQSHLIHDFEVFSGLRPTDYLRLDNNCLMQNHVLMNS